MPKNRYSLLNTNSYYGDDSTPLVQENSIGIVNADLSSAQIWNQGAIDNCNTMGFIANPNEKGKWNSMSYYNGNSTSSELETGKLQCTTNKYGGPDKITCFDKQGNSTDCCGTSQDNLYNIVQKGVAQPSGGTGTNNLAQCVINTPQAGYACTSDGCQIGTLSETNPIYTYDGCQKQCMPEGCAGLPKVLQNNCYRCVQRSGMHWEIHNEYKNAPSPPPSPSPSPPPPYCGESQSGEGCVKDNPWHMCASDSYKGRTQTSQGTTIQDRRECTATSGDHWEIHGDGSGESGTACYSGNCRSAAGTKHDWTPFNWSGANCGTNWDCCTNQCAFPGFNCSSPQIYGPNICDPDNGDICAGDCGYIGVNSQHDPVVDPATLTCEAKSQKPSEVAYCKPLSAPSPSPSPGTCDPNRCEWISLSPNYPWGPEGIGNVAGPSHLWETSPPRLGTACLPRSGKGGVGTESGGYDLGYTCSGCNCDNKIAEGVTVCNWEEGP